MKILALLIGATCVSESCTGQLLNYKDLFSLRNNDLAHADKYLSIKGWEFNSATVKDAASYFDYSMVSWSYDKNTWNEKAVGWFHLYQSEGYGNIVSYQTTSSTFNGLKAHTADVGLTAISTEVIEDGLTSVYRKGNIEVRFTASDYKGEDDYESEKHHTITLWNWKEFERKVLAIALEEELRKAEEARLEEERRKAEEERKRKEEEERKKEEARKLREFLIERSTTTYDYETINRSEFSSFRSKLLEEIKGSLKYEERDAAVDIDLVYVVDTLGRSKLTPKVNNTTNTEVSSKVISIAEKYKLEPAYKKGYMVKAKAEVGISIELSSKKFGVRKNRSGIKISDTEAEYSTEVNTLLGKTPVGKYRVSIEKKRLNTTDFSDNKILNYRGSDGPANALLSVLVVGLGDTRVNGGSGSLLRSPAYTATVAYGCLIYGGIQKFRSNEEYDKYLNATLQTEIELHYQKANDLHKYALIAGGVGGAIWIADVVWVIVQGSQNRQFNKTFRSRFAMNYDPNTNSVMMGYAIKF